METEVFGAYPLTWPEGLSRTPQHKRVRGVFKTSFAKARDQIFRELKLLGAEQQRPIVLSTDIPTRRDGLPYAGQANPKDSGCAVYFWLATGVNTPSFKVSQRVMACDMYLSVGDNLHAIELTIQALRGIKRWGTTEMFERAFTGFTALPAPGKPWFEILQCSPTASLSDARVARNRLASVLHPDRGGGAEAMAELNRAFAERETIGETAR